MEFKDRLKELRNITNISAQDLARELNKSESAIRMWEAGKTKPDADTLINLADYFNCTIDYLLGISDVRNEDEWIEMNDYNYEIIDELNKIQPKQRQDFQEAFGNILKFYELVDKIDKYKTNEALSKALMNKIQSFSNEMNVCGKILVELKQVEQSNLEIFHLVATKSLHDVLANTNETTQKLFKSLEEYMASEYKSATGTDISQPNDLLSGSILLRKRKKKDGE